MIFFTSDLHFFHKAVIDFENRPFEDVDEMNAEIVRRWNTVVKNDSDEIYILGDVSFGKNSETFELIKKLKGRKYLISGNHDKLSLYVRDQFEWIKDYHKLRIDNHRFILFHYPIYCWDGKEKGYIHLHGHVHTNSHEDIKLKNKINVGMNLWSFAPVSIDEIISKI